MILLVLRNFLGTS
jgi:hypothetical protein